MNEQGLERGPIVPEGHRAAAAQVFGRSRAEIEKFVAETGRTTADFYTFFWEYMLDEREGIDLKKEWKALARKS